MSLPAPQLSIFWPALALMGWTMLVLLLIPLARWRALRSGQLAWSDFSLGESARVPPQASLPNRAYMNLLELPVLFYAVCVMTALAQRTDGAALWLAWVYVALRLVHSLVHLTTNRVTHRFVAFGLSNMVLAGMIVRLGWQLASL